VVDRGRIGGGGANCRDQHSEAEEDAAISGAIGHNFTITRLRSSHQAE
jgi:hypothetical protein